MAISVSQSPPEDRFLIYIPGIEKQFGVFIGDVQNFHSYIKTPVEFQDYVTLLDDAQDSGPRGIQAIVRMPPGLKPGKYEIFMGGKEIASPGGMISALTAIQSRITVLSLYPGEYAIFNLVLGDVGVNESTNFTISVENYGINIINAAQGYIEIYGPDGEFVANITTNVGSVPVKTAENPEAQAILYATFTPATYNLKPGNFHAVGHLIYDGVFAPDSENGDFRVGSLTVKIIDWTRSLYINSTNKFEIKISSDWVGQIDDVYARIITPNHGTIKTPNLDLNRFSSATLETYWETDKLELNPYNVTIQLYYAGTMTEKVVEVNMTTGTPPVEERPKSNFTLTLGTNTIILIVLVLIFIFNIYFFVFRKKAPVSNDNLKPPKL